MANLGPLSQATTEGAEVPQGAPPKTQTEDMFSTILRTSMEKSAQTQRALDVRKNQLLNLSQQRMFNPTMMKFASGMLAPTKTGGFGESLGVAANAAAEEQEKEFARQQAFGKLQYELEAESAKQQQELAGQQIMANAFRRPPQRPSMSAVTAPPVADASGKVPAAPSAEQPYTTDMLEQMTGDQLFALSSFPSLKPQIDMIMKLREQSRKENVKMKIGDIEREVSKPESERYQRLSESGDLEGLRKWHIKHGFPFDYVEDGKGGFHPMTSAEKTASTEREKSKFGKAESVWVYELGRNIPLSPFMASEYEKARLAGNGDEWVKTNINKASLPPEKPEEAGKITSAQEVAKDIAETRKFFMGKGLNANELIVPAKEMLTLASNPIYSQAMGVIEGPGLKNAIAKAISEGVSVSDWKIGFPSIRAAILQLKTGPDGKPLSTETRQAIIDGASKYMQNATTIELLFTQSFMAKQGAITEGERALVRQTGPGKEDSPNVVKAKAKMLISKAEYDRKAAEAFTDWEKKNPNGTVEEFLLKSPEHKEIWQQREQESKAAYDEHFPSGGTSRPSSADRRNENNRRSSSAAPERNTTPGVNQDAINRFAPR
jgi:hypothetical protein